MTQTALKNPKVSYWYRPWWNARSDNHHQVSNCTLCGMAHVTEKDNPPQQCERCVPMLLAVRRETRRQND